MDIMRSSIMVLVLSSILVYCDCKERDKNKSMNSKEVIMVTALESERTNKNEKRTPLVMTGVAGEVKFNPEVKYRPEQRYPIQPDMYNPVQLLPTAPSSSQTAKPPYIMYTPQPQPPQMVLMLAVPHPSGQFLMLLPAQNFIYPMFYRPPLAQLGPITVPTAYQTPPSYQQTPQLSQVAGFVAQQQLTFPGPYRSEKYSNGKQN